MLMSALSTNWVINIPPNITNQWTAHTVPLVYQDCSCALSSQCVQPSRGMFAGCYPLEALLQSTLQCFYGQQCIDSNKKFEALNIFNLNSSRFYVNSIIESMVNELMVEEYSSNMSYESYFAQCAPSSCIYSNVDKSNIIDGITTIISLYGGLVIICRVFAVLIVKLFRHRTRTINPQIEQTIFNIDDHVAVSLSNEV